MKVARWAKRGITAESIGRSGSLWRGLWSFMQVLPRMFLLVDRKPDSFLLVEARVTPSQRGLEALALADLAERLAFGRLQRLDLHVGIKAHLQGLLESHDR